MKNRWLLQQGLRRPWRALAGVLIVAAGGCGPTNVLQQLPPSEVIVAHPVRRSVTEYISYTGTAQASERVELRARVKGFLKERKFKDGDDVKAGQLLFVIDEEPFQVMLDQARARLGEAEAQLRKAEGSRSREVAQAQLDLDEASLALAKIEEGRSRNLVSRNAGSREDLDRAEANHRKSEAQVEADRAALEQAKADYEINILSARSSIAAAKAQVRNAEIDLGYCRITAPIDGKIDNRVFDIGNYVGDGASTVLATVVKTDPIYAYITPSEDDLLRLQGAGQKGQPRDYRKIELPMELGLGYEEGYTFRGKVDYSDPSIDTGTGTIRMRGLFPNPDGAITPGLFVRVRMPVETKPDALLVPDRALGSDQGGVYLLVVDKDDTVQRRAVKSGPEDGTLRVVSGQLGLEDRVVVDGLLRARPGMKVKPKMEEPASAAVAARQPAETASDHRP
ncbi:efflux RND transporter periplasmic adaptor subunit [Tundrisphaera sp. TA3]|uniref:efflux RND transporter periplasmic adaptor subunit n=1 Tax=Tundrisphaera sp. TA3 TaxID=3435775 RepID=UPI003EBA6382